MVTRSRMKKSGKRINKAKRLKSASKPNQFLSEAGEIVSKFGMEIASTMKAGMEYEKQMKEKANAETPTDRKIGNQVKKVETKYKDEVSRIKKIERIGPRKIIIEVA